MKLPDIPQSDIDQSLFLTFLYKGSDRPVVFMPNYGEFGNTIDKTIKMVHFFQAPQKIVCCQPGEEAYYPSADAFYYDWTYDLVDDIHRWGTFTKKVYFDSVKS